MYTLLFLALFCNADTATSATMSHYVHESIDQDEGYIIRNLYDLQLNENGTFSYEHTLLNAYYLEPFRKALVTKEYGIYFSRGDTLELVSITDGGRRLPRYLWINNSRSLKPLGNTLGFVLTRMPYWTKYLPIMASNIKIDAYYQGHL
ncbi:hypothetical protein [Chitinophaga sp. Cy-1792]|uniref:hypothetical protein n=1 Tax=Chitinophaga sp. Cy-1792 TaxID=2608339 RepID=UPI001422F32F|nr:hypothetical protein [Chitinophaga sp. Cy-1792]NIG57214.1 hypothetical protein [Chitinophaga sp. Cy-1792]